MARVRELKDLQTESGILFRCLYSELSDIAPFCLGKADFLDIGASGMAFLPGNSSLLSARHTSLSGTSASRTILEQGLIPGRLPTIETASEEGGSQLDLILVGCSKADKKRLSWRCSVRIVVG